MASKTVSEFAQELKVAAKTLLAQLRAAGVNKASETDELSETDKTRLLDSLRVERTQSAQRKITVTRKEQSVVKQQDGSGRSRAIPVEVRRKRVFVKNPQVLAEEAARAEAEAAQARRAAEEKAAAGAAAEEAAKALTGKDINSVEALDAAIAALDINAETEAASTVYTNTKYSALNAAYVDWLTDASRKEGDVAYFANTTTAEDGTETVNGYYVVYFLSSTDNAFPLSNVRHILAAFEGGTKDETTGATTYSDEEKAAAKQKAEDLLEQWKSGDATEDSFAALANESSADGDGTTGGLYENIGPDTNFVEPFKAWATAEHKPGDTGIVETQYGYHVMYYVGQTDYTYRDYQIENELRNADVSKWYTETVEAVSMADGDTKYIRTDLILNNGK